MSSRNNGTVLSQDQESLLSLFISKGADLNIRNYDGDTPLTMADSFDGNREVGWYLRQRLTGIVSSSCSSSSNFSNVSISRNPCASTLFGRSGSSDQQSTPSEVENRVGAKAI